MYIQGMVRRSKEDALATRNTLLDAAERVFLAQGVAGTSLNDIALAAGTTRGAIYWHFKDKADLFNAMMDRVTLPLESATRAAAEAGEAPLHLVERSLVEALALTVNNPQVRRVFEVATLKVEYTSEMASVQERHLLARNQCVADFERALRLAARKAGVRLPVPATIAAQGLHAMVSGLIQDWLLDPSGFELVSAGRRLFHVYLSGLGLAAACAGTANPCANAQTPSRETLAV